MPDISSLNGLCQLVHIIKMIDNTLERLFIQKTMTAARLEVIVLEEKFPYVFVFLAVWM